MGREFSGFIREVRLDRAKVTDPARHPYDIPAVAALDVLPLAPGLTVLVAPRKRLQLDMASLRANGQNLEISRSASRLWLIA